MLTTKTNIANYCNGQACCSAKLWRRMSWDESGSNLKLRFQSEEETLEWVRRSYCITYMEWGCARKGNHLLQQKLLGQKVKKSKSQKVKKSKSQKVKKTKRRKEDRKGVLIILSHWTNDKFTCGNPNTNACGRLRCVWGWKKGLRTRVKS